MKKILPNLPVLGTTVPSEGSFDEGDPAWRRPLQTHEVASLSLLEQLRKDPAAIGFPAMLPVEIALKTGKIQEIFAHYGLGKDDYLRLREDPLFLEAVASAQQRMKDSGYSFRMKALLQSEEMLKSSWTLIHSADTPPNVKKDLIIATWRAAGVADPEQTESNKAVFNIQMNLG